MDGTSTEVSALRRLHELMCRVSAGEDLPAVLQELVDGVSEVAGFDVAAVSILHPHQEFEVLAVAGDETARTALLGLRTPLRDIAQEFALAENWGVLRYIPHERFQEDVPGWVPDYVPLDVPDAWHPKDVLLAPLEAPTGELLGLLSVDLPRDGRHPGRSAREALDMYAVQAGIAISNAKQRDQAREEIRLAGVVRDVAAEIAAAMDPTQVAHAVVQPISEGLRCDAVWLRTAPDADQPSTSHISTSVATLDTPAAEAAVNLAMRIAREAWSVRRAVVLADDRPLWESAGIRASSFLHRPAVSENDLLVARSYLVEAGCRSALMVPVGAGAEFLGYLLVARTTVAASWSEEEVAAALEIGREVGRAVTRARVYDELRQLDRHKSEMFATVAHELKNPLAAIAGHLEMLDASEPLTADPMAGRSLSAIDRAANRLTGLVDDLLVLARLRDQHRTATVTTIDLVRLVQDAADLLGAQAHKHDVAVRLDVARSGRPTVLAETGEVDRVVGNLLSNAIKFSPAGSTVTLSLRREGDAAVLCCTDEGMGISEADQRQLFTEFFRSTNPHAHQVPGTGLGLAIVHRIVTRLGGTVDVHSVVGSGSTFTVTLPTAVPAVEARVA